ncbi:MAG: FKBP-type peptidyl-prolyl cis-trans isomerase [bacterium]|nr:FKBP-type peptidyl-prolyl cis-trans isomerase [bacterium]
MSKVKRSISLIIALAFLFSSFAFTGFVVWTMIQENNEDDTTANLEEELMSQNQSTISEIQITDTVVGEGEEVKPGATVTVHYTGKLVSDGTVFDSSVERGEPATFGLNEVIDGWKEGIPGMKVGGKRILIVPANKAYGPQELPGIPANSDLQFEVELIAIEK